MLNYFIFSINSKYFKESSQKKEECSEDEDLCENNHFIKDKVKDF